MTSYANKGMYIEQLVERTILYYSKNNIGFIEKRQIPIKIIKHINETTILGKLISKAKVDYFGVINNKYFEMECKQTIHNYFDISLIKNHQLSYLKEISNKGYLSCILIFFELFNKIIAITYDKLMQCYKINKKKILPYNQIVKFGNDIEIIYPGIINLKKLFF